MSLRGAVVFAIIGTLLWTILTAVNLVRAISGVVAGIVPAVDLLSTLILFVTALSLLVFFVVFRGSQS